MNFTPNIIRSALDIPFDGWAAQKAVMRIGRPQDRPVELEGEGRKAAVLSLLYNVDGETYVVLTKRPDTLGDHAGQISFPGGRIEAGETKKSAVLRETLEEVGILSEKITLLGTLTKLYIPPSDFEVFPFVGWHDGQPDFIRNQIEVAKIIEAPLSLLMHPDTLQVEPWDFGNGYVRDVHYFLVGEHKVWGATAMMLNELLVRLQTVAEQ